MKAYECLAFRRLVTESTDALAWINAAIEQDDRHLMMSTQPAGASRHGLAQAIIEADRVLRGRASHDE